MRKFRDVLRLQASGLSNRQMAVSGTTGEVRACQIVVAARHVEDMPPA